MNEQEIAVVPVEEQISQELVKNNVTDTLIEKLKADYMPLQIAGIDDKETYLLVKEARKECKKWRVLAKKLCTKGREDAVAIQKAWVAKEKEVTEKIGEVEDHLEKQEKEFDAAVEAEKLRRKREQEEQFILRQQALSAMSVLYADGNFTLGDVSFEMSLIKECDPEIWENDIKPKFEEAHKIVMAEVLERERIKKEKEEEFRKQQEEFERKQRELEEKEAALKAAQEEQDKKERERIAEEERIKKEKLEKKFQDRLVRGHYNFNGFTVSYKDKIVGSKEDLVAIPEDDFNELVAVRELEIADEIEAQKEAERKMVLGQSRLKALKELGRVPIDATAISLSDLSEEEYDTLYANEKREYEAAKRKMWEIEQEDKRLKDEADQKAKMEAAKDKEKWWEMMDQIKAIAVWEMRSSQYRAKAKRFRELLDQIKALDNGQD
jgi:hypothetical protein